MATHGGLNPILSFPKQAVEQGGHFTCRGRVAILPPFRMSFDFNGHFWAPRWGVVGGRVEGRRCESRC